MPGMGVSRKYGNPSFEGMKIWRVPDFEKYLIFYTANEFEIRIIRALHGNRDIENLFSPDRYTP